MNSTLPGGKYTHSCSTNLSQNTPSNQNVDYSCDFSGHCKKLAPEYEAAAEVLSKQDPPRTIAKVDATEAKGLADRMSIKGFPTLYFFK